MIASSPFGPNQQLLSIFATSIVVLPVTIVLHLVGVWSFNRLFTKFERPWWQFLAVHIWVTVYVFIVEIQWPEEYLSATMGSPSYHWIRWTIIHAVAFGLVLGAGATQWTTSIIARLRKLRNVR